MINLIAGAVLIGFSVLLFLSLYWGTRKSRPPLWMSETLVANLHAPLLVATLAIGSGYLLKFVLIMGS
jgi:hypothetical protein